MAIPCLALNAFWTGHLYVQLHGVEVQSQLWRAGVQVRQAGGDVQQQGCASRGSQCGDRARLQPAGGQDHGRMQG